ncbi:MAG: ATP-binding cassette domain-containing protein [Candidatus Eisenbacteria bacterium]|nr:ATP-binding cassette domain-containing protein [Candidatus Eisenbacteria bacterium]
MMERVIETRKVTKHYLMGDLCVKALRGVDLTVNRGEFVAIMGASGSGKSTLLNVIGCLDRPTSGQYLLDGVDTSGFSRDQYAEVRNQRIGFVFQTFNLLPRTTALDNVELPLFYDRTGKFNDPRAAAVESLERVGLGDRMHHDPSELSGGQRQRVAMARALVNNPSIILADEPTGNLDSRTSVDVLSVFQELNEQGITVLLVTHETDIAQYAKRIVVMRDGLIVSDRQVWDRRSAAQDLEAMPSHDEMVELVAEGE